MRRLTLWIIMVLLVIAVPIYSQEEPPAISPHAQNPQSSQNSEYEDSKKFAKKIGVPKDVIKTLKSIPWIDVRTLTLETPFFERWIGSGVVVDMGEENYGFAFIAGHMFHPYRDLVCGVAVRTTLHFFDREVTGNILFYSSEGGIDLAVVRFENAEPKVRGLKIAEKDPEIGDELFAVGVPPVDRMLQTVVPLRFRGVASYQVWAQAGPHAFVARDVKRFLAYGSVDHGFSGGPALNQQGAIEGIVVGMTNGGAFTLIVARSHLMEAFEAVRGGVDFCGTH